MDNTLEAKGMGTCVQERWQARSQELQTSHSATGSEQDLRKTSEPAITEYWVYRSKTEPRHISLWEEQ